MSFTTFYVSLLCANTKKCGCTVHVSWLQRTWPSGTDEQRSSELMIFTCFQSACGNSEKRERNMKSWKIRKTVESCETHGEIVTDEISILFPFVLFCFLFFCIIRLCICVGEICCFQFLNSVLFSSLHPQVRQAGRWKWWHPKRKNTVDLLTTAHSHTHTLCVCVSINLLSRKLHDKPEGSYETAN